MIICLTVTDNIISVCLFVYLLAAPGGQQNIQKSSVSVSRDFAYSHGIETEGEGEKDKEI